MIYTGATDRRKRKVPESEFCQTSETTRNGTSPGIFRPLRIGAGFCAISENLSPPNMHPGNLHVVSPCESGLRGWLSRHVPAFRQYHLHRLVVEQCHCNFAHQSFLKIFLRRISSFTITWTSWTQP